MIWDQPWLWIAAGIVLLILEVVVSGFILLGFGVGALIVGLLLVFGGNLIASLPIALLVFAVSSLVAWIVIRKLVGVRKGQVKIWDTDINED